MIKPPRAPLCNVELIDVERERLVLQIFFGRLAGMRLAELDAAEEQLGAEAANRDRGKDSRKDLRR